MIGRVFLYFAAGYFLSYALRVINAIIGPALLQELGLSNGQLGFISAAYLITFAGLQLPLGIWLDRYGSRRVESALLLVAALGCALFALGHSVWVLWLGRALIGVGVSACLMAALKAFRQWFEPKRQSQLGSGMFVAGTLGALFATIPVNVSLPILGWRGIFWVMALLLLITSALLFIGLKPVEAAHQSPAPPDLAPPPTEGYRQIFQDPYFRRMACIGIANQGSLAALQSLWLGPWMIQVVGLSKSESADALFAFNLVLLGAFLLFSWRAAHHIVIDGAKARGPHQFWLSQVITWGIGAGLLIQALCLFMDARWAWALWLLFALFQSVTSLLQSHIGLSFPVRLAGRANTAFNLLVFLGAFGMQAGLGILIDFLSAHGLSSSNAMRWAFGVGLLWQIAGWAGFVRSRAKVSHVD